MRLLYHRRLSFEGKAERSKQISGRRKNRVLIYQLLNTSFDRSTNGFKNSIIYDEVFGDEGIKDIETTQQSVSLIMSPNPNRTQNQNTIKDPENLNPQTTPARKSTFTPKQNTSSQATTETKSTNWAKHKLSRLAEGSLSNMRSNVSCRVCCTDARVIFTHRFSSGRDEDRRKIRAAWCAHSNPTAIKI